MIRVKLFDTICDSTIHLKWKTEADFHRQREQITLFTEKHKRSDSIKTIIRDLDIIMSLSLVLFLAYMNLFL